jgi:hypothetical protein
MVQKIFTIYDSKAEAYLSPFFMSAKGQALRAFGDSVNDPNHQFNKHAEDFTLFELGEYDDLSASFNLYDTPVALGKAIEFITN